MNRAVIPVLLAAFAALVLSPVWAAEACAAEPKVHLQSPSSSQAAAKPKAFLVVTFDVEDYISPESEHIDDIPKWLAETMTEEGVTGTFFVIGEKARSLEKRGRRDVIAAMAKHDIGSHTNFGSIHPTVTEELEKAGWADGVGRMLGQESAGIKELEHIYKVPVRILARHGGSYGPQLVSALGQMDAAYQGSPAKLPGHDVVWFCNALNFSAQYSGFDDSYYRDDLFEPVFEKLKADLPKLAQTTQVIALFAGHPTKIRAEEFWDLNFYYGKNTSPAEWVMPRLRPAETMATAQKNFRRMMHWLKGRDDIVITNYRDLMPAFSARSVLLAPGELRGIAADTLRRKTLAPTASFSPAEIFAALAHALEVYSEKGAAPQEFAPKAALGPLEMPPSEPEVPRVKLADVLRLAGSACLVIDKTGAMPAWLSVENKRIGAGSLLAVFSAVYLDARAGRARPEYDVPAFEPYPRTNEAAIIKEVEGYKTWPVHRLDLDMSKIVEFTKLQLWTLKPAERR